MVEQQDGSARDAGRQIEAGFAGRPHGLDGSFHVNVARPRLLRMGGSVTVAGRDREIVRLAGTDKRPIVRLDGVEDRAAAEQLRGRPLLVAAAEAPALAPDEYWAHELEGCRVHDGARDLGVVRRLIELPSCEALEVRRPGGGELLVPMVRDAIRSVDIEHREIEVDAAFLGAGKPTGEGSGSEVDGGERNGSKTDAGAGSGVS